MGTIAILTLLAVDRVRVVRGYGLSTTSTEKHPAMYVVAAWSWALIISCPPLLGWGHYALEGPGISCSIDWMNITFNSLSYTAFILLIAFLAPVIVIFSSYVGICFTLHKVIFWLGLLSF